MSRNRALVGLVLLASMMLAWLLPWQPGGKRGNASRAGADSPSREELLERALQRIVSAPDPFHEARNESARLQASTGQTLALVKGAWDEGAHWPACAVISVLRGAASAALSWVAEAADGDAAGAGAAVLARWFIDADTDRAIEVLLARCARGEDDELAEAHRIVGRMRAAGARPTRALIDQLGERNRFWAVALIRTVGAEAAEAVPAVEALIGRLGAEEDDSPVFGTDGSYGFMEALLHALPDLGSPGIDAAIHLLYSPNGSVSWLASDVMLDDPHRFRVTQVLRAAPRGAHAASPTAVYDVLAHLPGSAAEWEAALAFTSRANERAKLAFFDALLEDPVERDKRSKLVEVILSWKIDDPEVESRRLDVLVRVAAVDPRITRIVQDVLAHGRADARADMLRRMDASFSAFLGPVRAAALALTSSSEPLVRAAAIGLLRRRGEPVADRRALVLIRAALHDGKGQVLVAAFRAMASHGLAARSLVSLALARSASCSPRMQIDLLRAVVDAGANQHPLIVQVRRAWNEASRSAAREDLREAVVEVLEEIQRGGARVSGVARDLLKADDLSDATKKRLRVLRGGRR